MIEANQESSDKDPHLKYRKEAKGWAITGAVIYSLFAIFFTYFYVVFSVMALDNPDHTFLVLSLIVCYSFLLPVPWPMYLMLKTYLKKQNKPILPSLLVLILYYSAVTVFALIVFGVL